MIWSNISVSVTPSVPINKTREFLSKPSFSLKPGRLDAQTSTARPATALSPALITGSFLLVVPEEEQLETQYYQEWL